MVTKSAQGVVSPANELEKSLDNARYCAFQLGDFAAAEQHYRAALAFQANRIETLVGLGQILCRRQRRAEGKIYLEKAAKLALRRIDKTETQTLLDLAEQLRQWGHLESALQLFRAVLKRSPQNLQAHHGLASCLHRLNQTDLAMASMQKLLTLHDDNPACQLQMALMETDTKQFAPAKHRLESIVANAGDPRQLTRAHLELARIHDKEGQHAKAFAAIETAFELNRQLPEISTLDASGLFNKITRYQQGLDDSLLLRWQPDHFADGLPVPVFLMGFLRSGTTLLEQALAAHPGILASDENPLINELDAELAAISGIRNDTVGALRAIDDGQARQLRQFYWHRVREEYGPDAPRKVFVNKTSLNSIEIGLISCLFPEAKIIFAVRDPRDVCLSCAMQAFTPSPATVNLYSWQGIAAQYAAVIGLWLHLRNRIAPAYFELRYEDTVSDFSGSLSKVLALLGLEWLPQIERFYQNSQGKYIATPSYNDVSRPIYRDSLARWKAYQPYFESIEPILRPSLKAFGYSD